MSLPTGGGSLAALEFREADVEDYNRLLSGPNRTSLEAPLASPATGSFFGNTDIFGGSYLDPTNP